MFISVHVGDEIGLEDREERDHETDHIIKSV